MCTTPATRRAERRGGHDLHGGMDFPDVAKGAIQVEGYVWQQVDLGEDDGARLAEHLGVLDRFVFAFRDRKQHDLCVLAEVPAGRAHQVAHVLDEQEICRGEIDRVERRENLARIEVTGAVGDDGLHQVVGMARQPVGVVLGLDVTRDDGDGELGPEVGERPLEQQRLSGARRRNQVERRHGGGAQPLAHDGGQLVVFRHDAFANVNRPDSHRPLPGRPGATRRPAGVGSPVERP